MNAWTYKSSVGLVFMKRSLLTAIALTATVIIGGITNVPSAARADAITTSAVTDVFFNTNGIVTLQTEYGALPFALTGTTATAAGQYFASQIAIDPQALYGQASLCIGPTGIPTTTGCPVGQPVPAFVLNAISNAVDANILGLNGGVVVPIEPNPAQTAFDNIVGINSSFVQQDTDLELTYQFIITIPNGGPDAGEQLSILDNFQIFQATPIPTTFPLFATGLGAMGLLSRRKKRMAAAV
jgi:hypothetical protein